MISQDCESICSEPLSEVEGYISASLDQNNTWHLHHKIGAICQRSVETMKEMGLYYNRPANELQFLLPRVHHWLHHKLKVNPRERERLRRKEMAYAYRNWLPTYPWELTAEECDILNEDLEMEDEED